MALMEKHRKRMLERPGEFAGIIEPILAREGFADKSTRYKRPKEGGNPEIDRWYQLKNCYVGVDIPVGDELFSKDLPDRLVKAFEVLSPLYHYFRMLETL